MATTPISASCHVGTNKTARLASRCSARRVGRRHQGCGASPTPSWCPSRRGRVRGVESSAPALATRRRSHRALQAAGGAAVKVGGCPPQPDNHHVPLTRYLDDGRLPIDNGIVEGSSRWTWDIAGDRNASLQTREHIGEVRISSTLPRPLLTRWVAVPPTIPLSTDHPPRKTATPTPIERSER